MIGVVCYGEQKLIFECFRLIFGKNLRVGLRSQVGNADQQLAGRRYLRAPAPLCRKRSPEFLRRVVVSIHPEHFSSGVTAERPSTQLALGC